MSSQATSPNDKTSKATSPKGLLPPEEKFWQRYSRHQEFPLSGLGSFMLHVLFIGLLLLMAIGVIKLGGKEKLPVEAVEIGGGGGSRDGEDDGKGLGRDTDAPKEDVARNDKPLNDTVVPPKPLALDPAKAQEAKVDFNDEMIRYVKAGDEAKTAFTKLNQEVQRKLRDGLSASKGRGGAGKDGGKGGGQGSGEGDGRGPGEKKTSLTQREKRMLRWSMTFNTGFNGGEYLNQLAGLGAILAIPTGPGNPPPGYFVLRDLKQRQELKEEDLGQIRCIFWVDDRPESVRSLINALGLKLEVSHIVAFMPAKVEEDLFNIEGRYRQRPEDEIYETKFQVRKKPSGGYEPFVVAQTPKR